MVPVKRRGRKKLKNYVSEKLNSVKGKLGVYYENLVTGENWEVLSDVGDDVFEAASVIKLWIMSAAYDLAEQGELDLEKKIILQESDMVPEPGLPDYNADRLAGRLTEDMFPESGVLNYLHPGLELTVRDLVKLMILISDNTATNIMIDLLGKERINRHIRRLGAEKTILNRKLFDTSPEVLGKENMISLKETADYLRMLYRGELVSKDASREMLAILQNQQNTYKIPFYIRRFPIAHKTGEDTGIENDVGIVFADEPFILCFCANGADETAAVRACQDIAKAVCGKRLL